MARIRTIKPEFFTSESVLSVSPLARLFFIGLWCEADRDGRLKWKPKTLKFRYLPGDSVNIEKLCSELESEGMIITYSIDDVDYCEIPGFENHQVINNRERESLIPSRVNDASTTRESGRKEGKEGKGKEGKEYKGNNKDKSLSCPIQDILDIWKEKLPNKTQPRAFDGTRAQALKARWSDAMKLTRDDGEQYYVDSESGLIWWGKLFGYIANHNFLNNDKSNWLTLQWLTKKENFLKVVERTYDN